MFQPSDITIVKSMKSPPAGVKLVMAAVCVMKDIKPDRIADPNNPVGKVSVLWTRRVPFKAMLLLGDSHRLVRLCLYMYDGECSWQKYRTWCSSFGGEDDHLYRHPWTGLCGFG